jgi:hypothetical protein
MKFHEQYDAKGPCLKVKETATLNTCKAQRMSFVVANYMKNIKRKLVTHVEWTWVLSNYMQQPTPSENDTRAVDQKITLVLRTPSDYCHIKTRQAMYV